MRGARPRQAEALHLGFGHPYLVDPCHPCQAPDCWSGGQCHLQAAAAEHTGKKSLFNLGAPVFRTAISTKQPAVPAVLSMLLLLPSQPQMLYID
jgi:hypothetical protein